MEPRPREAHVPPWTIAPRTSQGRDRGTSINRGISPQADFVDWLAVLAAKLRVPERVPPVRSELGHPTVDDQIDAGGEAALIGREKEGGRRDLRGSAQPAERHHPGGGAPELGGGVLRTGL